MPIERKVQGFRLGSYMCNRTFLTEPSIYNAIQVRFLGFNFVPFDGLFNVSTWANLRGQIFGARIPPARMPLLSDRKIEGWSYRSLLFITLRATVLAIL